MLFSHFYNKSESDLLYSWNNVIEGTPTIEGATVGKSGGNYGIKLTKAVSGIANFIDFAESGVNYRCRLLYHCVNKQLSIIADGGVVVFETTGLKDCNKKTDVYTK